MRPRTRVILYVVLAAAGAAGLGLNALQGDLPRLLPVPAWIAVGALLGFWVARYVDRRSRVPEEVAPLVLEGRRLTLPLGPTSAQVETIDVAEVQSVEVVEPKFGGRLLIGTEQGVFAYPLTAFEDPRAAVQLARAIVLQVGGLEGGEARLQDMQRRQQVSLRFGLQRPRATRALMLLIFAMFGLQHLSGAFDGSFFEQQAVMLRMGANASLLVGQGEWWRLFVANFLHGGWLHIGLNGLALLSLGSVLERLVGTLRFLLVYLVSALGGALASAWAAQGPFSVGASTAIFGLLGAFAVLSYRFGGQFPAGVRQTRRWWIFVLGVNALLPLLVPMIDVAAHAGGFVAGAAAMFFAYPTVKYFDPWARSPLGIIAATGLLAMVFTFAGLRASEYRSNPPKSSQAVLLDILAADPRPESQNLHAWSVLTTKGDYSLEDFEAARVRIQKVLKDDRLSGYVDTLATAEYRLGDYEGAARHEREAMVLFAKENPPDEGWRRFLPGPRDDGKVMWSQLARFLKPIRPLVQGPAGIDEVQLILQDGGLQVQRPQGLPLLVFAQVWAQGAPRGVLRVGVEAQDSASKTFDAPEALLDLIKGQVDLRTLWVDTSTAGPRPEELGLQFRAHDPEVDTLVTAPSGP